MIQRYINVILLLNLGKKRLDDISKYFSNKASHLSFKKYRLKHYEKKQCYIKTRKKILIINLYESLYLDASKFFSYENLLKLKSGSENTARFYESVAKDERTSTNLLKETNWESYIGIPDQLKNIKKMIEDEYLEEEKKDILKEEIIKKIETDTKKDVKRIIDKERKKHENILDRILREEKNKKLFENK